MLDEKKTHLRLVADHGDATLPLEQLVACYDDEIEHRRVQLQSELAHFETKLHDLSQLDPSDFTGLGKIYREHANHIRRLLSEFMAA